MGSYSSAFMVQENDAISKHTHPSQPNWITIHAVASECKYVTPLVNQLDS